MSESQEFSRADIVNNLVEGKVVTIAIGSEVEAQKLKSSLSVIKSRNQQQLKSIGWEVEESTLRHEIIYDEGGAVSAVKYWLTVKPAHTFKVISVDTLEDRATCEDADS